MHADGPGSELDAARREVAERGLVGDAVTQLNEVVTALPLDALAPVKGHLKRFFSDAPWTGADDDALADVVGPGTGGARHDLAPDLLLEWEWVDGRFRLRVAFTDAGAGPGPPTSTEAPAEPEPPERPESTDLEASFAGPVTPEATPSPRTIRFATPTLHRGPSHPYESAEAAAADSRVARLFREFDAVTNVLVGPDFVAVSLSRPAAWESLLAPILAAVTDEFAVDTPLEDEPAGDDRSLTAPMTVSFSVGTTSGETRPRHLERAWGELGGLDPNRPRDLDRLAAASEDPEPARRQVVAALLAEGPREIATRTWTRLLRDSSRSVRRSTVDAMVDTEWPEVRTLLEDAVVDDDAWVRWKAIKGIARLGVGRSRAAVEMGREDPDFRVRLEAAAALRQAS